MKNIDKEKWMDDVFESMKGSHRAKPRPELFARIEDQIYAPTAKVIPVFKLRVATAAAIFLLIFNVVSMRHYAQNAQVETAEYIVENESDQQLISNFNLYE
jgi:hypothetical protein